MHYKDGDTKQGVPLSWNIEDDGFLMRPEGDGAEALQMYIPFRDLKGVFFVKHFDKEIARKINVSAISARKDHIAVHFRDGEKIEGYTLRDYDPKSPRFLMVPKEEKDKEESNLCILVERKSTKSINVLAKHG